MKNFQILFAFLLACFCFLACGTTPAEGGIFDLFRRSNVSVKRERIIVEQAPSRERIVERVRFVDALRHDDVRAERLRQQLEEQRYYDQQLQRLRSQKVRQQALQDELYLERLRQQLRSQQRQNFSGGGYCN